MRILYTLFLTAMVAITMERCRGEYLLVAVEEDDDLRKPKNDDIRNDDDDLRKSKTDDLRAEKSRGCWDCGFIWDGICCKFDNGTERCAPRENCPTYGKDNRVAKTAMDKNGMLPPEFCSNDMDCGFGWICDNGGCVLAPNKAETPEEEIPAVKGVKDAWCEGRPTFGLCDKAISGFTFDPVTKTCKSYDDSGCGETKNSYRTLEECETKCKSDMQSRTLCHGIPCPSGTICCYETDTCESSCL